MRGSTRNFWLIAVGHTLSSIGSWILATALPIWVYRYTESTTALGAIVAVQILPALLLGPIAGVFADRWNKRSVLLVTTALQGFITLGLLTVQSLEQLPIIYIVAFLNAVAATFFQPAEEALLPTLIERDQLMKANSLLAILGTSARFVGPALGGLLITTTSLGVTVIVDVFSFWAMTVAVFALSVDAEQPVPTKDESILASLNEGIQFIRNNRIIIGVICTWALLMLTAGLVETILVAFVKEAGGTDQTFSYSLSLQGAGLIVGGILTMMISDRVSALRTYQVGLVLLGFSISLLALYPSLYGLMLFVGLTMAITGVSEMTLFQEQTTEQFRGRILAVDNFIASCCIIIGAGVAGILADKFGTQLVMQSGGILSLFAAFIGFWIFRGTGGAERGEPIAELPTTPKEHQEQPVV